MVKLVEYIQGERPDVPVNVFSPGGKLSEHAVELRKPCWKCYEVKCPTCHAFGNVSPRVWLAFAESGEAIVLVEKKEGGTNE